MQEDILSRRNDAKCLGGPGQEVVSRLQSSTSLRPFDAGMHSRMPGGAAIVAGNGVGWGRQSPVGVGALPVAPLARAVISLGCQ